MKNILSVIIFFMVFTTITNAQYSNYYNLNVNQNLNLNANINQNIKVSGTIFENKTITTIDYGALSLANAQREANRLESIKYADEQQRRISLEIASDPVKAYDYGYNRNFTIKGKDAKPYGFKKFSVGYIIPNSALFVPSGAGRFENVSYDGITTEIVFNGPIYLSQKVDVNIEKSILDSVIVGKLKKNSDGSEVFVHKKEVSKVTVFGVNGFKGTIIYEDNYQYTISDGYKSYNPNERVYYSVKVRTYGNKAEVNFEKLEGRRYYLRRLIEKVISTAMVYDMKY